MYQKIFDDLLGGIKGGVYTTGDRLPSEKELMDRYQVSRITVKKALEILAYRGYILRKPGKGSFVASQSNIDKIVEEDILSEEMILKEAKTHDSSTQMIGVILDSFCVSFGCDLIKGIEYECRKRGFLMLFRCSYGSKQDENNAINEMIHSGAKGIILMCSQGEVYNETVLELYVNKYPLILLDREMAGISLPVVATDNYKASYELVTKLIEQGHKKICFVSHSAMNITTVKERFDGYRDAIVNHQLSFDESMWITDVDKYLPNREEDFQKDGMTDHKLADYIQKNQDITAYYSVDHELGMLLFRIMKELGVEKEKKIAFFDGFEEDLDILPIFPHVMQDQYQMGVAAVRLLAHRLKGNHVSGRENIPYSIVMEKE